MAVARKRNRKGQFLKGRTTTRKTTPKRRAAPRRTAAPRRATSYRRNPAKPDVVKMLTRGTLTATQVLLGKAATRAVPDVMNLPKAGNAGLAVQVATALALGYVGEMFFSKPTAAALLAGGLTAPVETLLVSANIPYVSSYLSPVATAGAVQGYVQGYVPRRKPLSGYVTHGGAATPPSVYQDEESYPHWM